MCNSITETQFCISASYVYLTLAEIMNNYHNGFVLGEQDLDGNDLPNDNVRDYALFCLNALLKVGIDVGILVDGDGDDDGDGAADKTYQERESSDWRIGGPMYIIQNHVAQKAIQRRYATLDDCDDDSDYNDKDDDYDDVSIGGDGPREAPERDAIIL